MFREIFSGVSSELVNELLCLQRKIHLHTTDNQTKLYHTPTATDRKETTSESSKQGGGNRLVGDGVLLLSNLSGNV